MQLIRGLLKSQTTYFVAFAFLIIYVALRAVFVNITHDEAWSFHNIKNFWYAEFLCTGNSHWFNSLAMKTSMILGFEKVFFLRWLSLVSFMVTCGFGLWWLKSFEDTSTKTLAFCIVFLNPYLLDYFGLARGYAGAMMLQCLTLYFFLKGINNQKRNTFLAALVCSGLSALSNYGFVYFFFAFSLLYFYTIYLNQGKALFKNKQFYFDLAFVFGIAFIIVRAFIFILRCSGDVVGAGEPSFLSMFHVFWDGLSYYKFTFSKLIQYGFSLVVFLLIALSCTIGILKKTKHQNNLYYFSSIILSIMILNMVLNYFCFNVVYPFYRAAQLLFIPSYIVIVHFFTYLISPYKLIKTVSYLISAVLLINFIYTANITYAFDYREQADSEDCFNRVKNLNAKHVGISPELYGVFANYYQMSDTKNYKFVGDIIVTCFPKGKCTIPNKLAEFDYLIVFAPYNLSYYKNSNVLLSAVYLSPTTKNLILRVEKKP